MKGLINHWSYERIQYRFEGYASGSCVYQTNNSGQKNQQKKGLSASQTAEKQALAYERMFMNFDMFVYNGLIWFETCNTVECTMKCAHENT